MFDCSFIFSCPFIQDSLIDDVEYSVKSSSALKGQILGLICVRSDAQTVLDNITMASTATQKLIKSNDFNNGMSNHQNWKTSL